jgi:hypothetical protein
VIEGGDLMINNLTIVVLSEIELKKISVHRTWRRRVKAPIFTFARHPLNSFLGWL